MHIHDSLTYPKSQGIRDHKLPWMISHETVHIVRIWVRHKWCFDLSA